MTKNTFILLLVFVFLGTVLYTYNLGGLPFSIHGDEGETATQALLIKRHVVGLIGVGWYDLPLFAFAPHALSMQLFGETVIGNRLGSVIFGVFTLPFFYLLTELLFKKRVAFVATILLATSHIFIAFSRVGITYVQATFLTVTTFYVTFYAFKHLRKRYFLLSGGLLGLCFYVYYAARITPLIIAPFFLLFLLQAKNKITALLSLFLFIVAFLLISLPQGLFFLNHPQTFSSRTESVYIFSKINLPSMAQEYATSDKFKILWYQTENTFNIFAGDKSGQYGYKGMLFDYLTIILFLLGLIFCFKFFTKNTAFVTWWIFLGVVIGQIVTTAPSPIFLPRFIAVLPALFIICALGLELLLKPIKSKQTQHVIIAGILVIIITYNLWVYFFSYPAQLAKGIAGDPNATAATHISYQLNKLNKPSTIFFLTAPYLYGNFGTIRFLSPRVTTETVLNPSVLATPSAAFSKNTYVIYPQYYSLLQSLKNTFPKGKTITIYDGYNKEQVYIFEAR